MVNRSCLTPRAGKASKYISLIGLVPGWLYFEAHFECHDILILSNDILMFGKRPQKWKQRPDMIIAVDLDVHVGPIVSIQTNKYFRV